MSRKLLSFCISYKNYGLNFMARNSYKNVDSYRKHELYPAIGYIRYSTHEYSNTVTYEEVREVSEDKCKKVLLIDVREPEELSETGILPTSINIPLGDLESVLKNMSNEQFLKKYGKEKPNENFPVIFSCKSGKRSATACEISQKLGFKNVKNYLGGWTDWSERNQIKIRLKVAMKFTSRSNNYFLVKFPFFVCLSNICMTSDVLALGQNNTNAVYKKVSFEEVNKLKDDPNYILIDVREPSEFAEGSIPGSINIPLNDLENALTKLSTNDFKNVYGREKPDKNFNIIFSCKSGRRSQLAQEKAVTLGYRNVSSYSGSWLDWESHTKTSKNEN